jgi:hypothetical protein
VFCAIPTGFVTQCLDDVGLPHPLLDSIATVLVVAGIVTCSIVIAEWAGNADRTDLTSGRDAPEARGLISIREESWPQTAGSSELRAVISIEATNGESIRWYARKILRLDRASASWDDMERQIAASDAHRRITAGRERGDRDDQ